MNVSADHQESELLDTLLTFLFASHALVLILSFVERGFLSEPTTILPLAVIVGIVLYRLVDGRTGTAQLASLGLGAVLVSLGSGYLFVSDGVWGSDDPRTIGLGIFTIATGVAVLSSEIASNRNLRVSGASNWFVSLCSRALAIPLSLVFLLLFLPIPVLPHLTAVVLLDATILPIVLIVSAQYWRAKAKPMVRQLQYGGEAVGATAFLLGLHGITTAHYCRDEFTAGFDVSYDVAANELHYGTCTTVPVPWLVGVGTGMLVASPLAYYVYREFVNSSKNE